ncbi:hypothetical protein IC232_08115 [Microvirga sp. BT688]|uniref:hypothetical protein n=1 Tax=Microvirga sp. TaxID=1873136 RepID=UPI001688E850|nr:hypothetical protein [Microvirga sp.]MBD2746666.1 hypothetical protein [Microvirga sp.]
MKRIALTAAVVLVLSPLFLPTANAASLPGIDKLRMAIEGSIDWAQIRRGGAVRQGFVARGPRGGVVAGRRTAIARPGYRPVRPLPRPVVVAPGWRRPAAYWWRPGAAVAAGAAVGFVTAAAATAYVNSRPPAPGYCWYYTNPQRTQGFWDVCPR